MVNELINILKREAELFETFLDLLEGKQRARVENNAEQLHRMTEQQREKLVASRLLARRREDLIERIKKANVIDSDLSVTRLVSIVDTDQAPQLTRLRSTILKLTDRMAHTRNQNGPLLNRTREYIARTLDLLARVNGPQSVCQSGGGEQHLSANVAVDSSA